MRKWNDDPYTKKARRENYEARSIYKLSEIDQKERLFKGVRRILDLGAAPGSWTQYCLEKAPSAKIIACDLSELQVTDERITFLHQPIEEIDFAQHLGNEKVDLVLSDMAPRTSGLHDMDVLLSIELATCALTTAQKFLKPGGSFVVKVFMGSGFEDYQKLVKANFGHVRLIRPDSTRKQSREIFFVGKEFKGI